MRATLKSVFIIIYEIVALKSEYDQIMILLPFVGYKSVISAFLPSIINSSNDLYCW